MSSVADDVRAGTSKVIAGASEVIAGASKLIAGSSDVRAGSSDVRAGAVDLIAGAGIVIAGASEKAMNTYSSRELARATGVGRSAIRHYVRLGLMVPAERHGPNARYDERHLHIVLAVRRLREQGLRGNALASRIHGASREDIMRLAGIAVPPPPIVSAAPPEPPPRTEASLREAVDSFVCAVAEALDASPRALRPALAILFERMQSANVTAEQAASVVRGA